MILLGQMVVLFIIMAIGFFCGKKGFINDAAAKNMSFIVVNIANPGMILAAGMDDEATIKGAELLYMFGLAIAVFAFLILLAYLICPLLGIPKADRGIYRVMTIFSNIGFMGFPILQAA